MISLVKTNLTTKLEKARHLLGFLFLAWFLGCGQPKQYLEIYGETMGTTYFIRMVPDSDLSIKREMLKVGIDSILSAVDRQMSTYRLDSEISIFNSLNKNEAIHISDEFAIVLPLTYPYCHPSCCGERENPIGNIQTNGNRRPTWNQLWKW